MSSPITLSNPGLWRKIDAFEIDDGTPRLTFASRLARENGWSVAFAQRVVQEYRRFVYLAMTAGHRVTPSEHVDQAWHLHMVYTGSYWDRLCGEVLPRPLEHTPTKGGKSEDAKFDDWYARTKESYEREFGHEPPRDIWPGSETRFGHDLHWRRVNTADCWVLPKRRTAGIFALLAAGSGMAACGVGASTMLAATSTNRKDGWLISGCFLVLLGIILAVRAIAGRGGGSGGGSWFGGGCGSSGCASSGCGGGGCGGGCGD